MKRHDIVTWILIFVFFHKFAFCTSCPHHLILSRNKREQEKKATHPVFYKLPCIIVIRSSLSFVEKIKVHVNVIEADCNKTTEVR